MSNGRGVNLNAQVKDTVRVEVEANSNSKDCSEILFSIEYIIINIKHTFLHALDRMLAHFLPKEL